jgi:hypothetical protein
VETLDYQFDDRLEIEVSLVRRGDLEQIILSSESFSDFVRLARMIFAIVFSVADKAIIIERGVHRQTVKSQHSLDDDMAYQVSSDDVDCLRRLLERRRIDPDAWSLLGRRSDGIDERTIANVNRIGFTDICLEIAADRRQVLDILKVATIGMPVHFVCL